MQQWVLRFCLATILLCPFLLAQSESGTASLNGTVTDASGAAVPAARVTVTSTDTGLTRTTTTNEAGLYTVVRLPVGHYDVVIDKGGFGTTRRTGITLTVGSATTLDVTLQVGTAQQEVTVSGEAPVVETTRSQTSTTVTEQQVRDLPVNGRNFLDFTLLSPGVVRDPRGGDLSFGGQRGTANSLLIDGADANNVFFGQSLGRVGVRNPYSFSEDSVQEFQVNTNAYSAEFGRAGGGLINVVTRSGSNTFHGGAFEFFRDRGLNANTFINNSRGLPKGAYHYNQFGGNLSGPIVKNKLFFFVNYDGQRNATPNTVILGTLSPTDPTYGQALSALGSYLTPYATQLTNDVYLGKVDWNISDRDQLSVRYNVNRFTGVNFENAGQTSAAEHTGDSQVNTDSVAGNYTHTFGPAVIYDSRYVYTKDNEPGQANATAPETVITGILSFGRNSFSPRYTNIKNFQTIQTLSVTPGRHSLKFGSDILVQRIANFFPGNFSGSYTFNNVADYIARRPARYTQAFAGQNTAGALTNPNVNEYAFFAQDNWRATDRLTLNLGIRYDLEQWDQPPVINPDSVLTSLGLNTGRINLDNNNLGGRFGFAYRLTRGEKMVLRGGAGSFYARTPAILTGTQFSQNGIQVQTFTLNSTVPAQAAVLPTYPNVLSTVPSLGRTPDIFVTQGNFVNPLTYQWSLNLETQLASDYALTVGYLGVRGEHLTRTRDVNLFPSVLVTGQLAGGAPISFYRHPAGRPYANFGRINVFDSGGDSIYHGGFLQLNKRFSHGFQALASYTFSHVIDTRPDATAVVVGADDAKIVQDTLQPNLDRGNGDADVRHRFVFSGIWDIGMYTNSMQNAVARNIFGNWQVSTITTLQSGNFFSARVNVDINNDGNSSNDRVPFIGRNTIEGPGFAQVDVRVTKDIRFGERVQLRLIGEAFNLTNRANFTAIQLNQYNLSTVNNITTLTPTTNYLTPTANAGPNSRILQLAARFRF